jgi:hypothetical protein
VRPSSKDEIGNFKRVKAADEDCLEDQDELDAVSVVYLVEAEDR